MINQLSWLLRKLNLKNASYKNDWSNKYIASQYLSFRQTSVASSNMEFNGSTVTFSPDFFSNNPTSSSGILTVVGTTDVDGHATPMYWFSSTHCLPMDSPLYLIVLGWTITALLTISCGKPNFSAVTLKNSFIIFLIYLSSQTSHYL